ncbi:hypothetical protein FK519_27460, partial [Klebsiella pneumoniae]|nr:hypothetical protein [Klebsiella pneumoniae]
MYIRQLTMGSRNDLLIAGIVAPRQIPITFGVDTGAQISAIKRRDAAKCGIQPSKKQSLVADAFGNVQRQPSVSVSLRLPGDEKADTVAMVAGEFPLNLLGLGLLTGRSWSDNQGGQWSFGKPGYDT